MSDFVLDCSVVMSWCFEDEGGTYAVGVLRALEQKAGLAPDLLALEIANVLVAAERRRRLTEADGSRFLDLLADLPVTMETMSPQRSTGPILSVARRFGLSSYDGTYLELAMRVGLPLATRDRGLRAACRKAGVALFKP